MVWSKLQRETKGDMLYIYLVFFNDFSPRNYSIRKYVYFLYEDLLKWSELKQAETQKN